MNKKVIIIVQNSNQYPSNIIIPFIKKTWVKKTDHKVFFYQGENKHERIDKMDIYLDAPGHYAGMGEKFIKCIELVDKKFEYDYIFNTTTGSYINSEKFDQFIKNLPKKSVYCAPEDFYPPINRTEENTIAFGSGRGVFLSRDIIKLIINKKNEWDHSIGLNDVSLGKLLNENNIPLTIGYRQDFFGYPQINELNSDNYHFGFRLDTSGIPRFFEIISLLSINNKIKYLRKENKIRYVQIKIFDFVFHILFSIISTMNLRHHSSSYKAIVNSMFNFIYKRAKKNSYMYKQLKKLKKKFNIKTEI
tara:strand:- start:4194 stop:5105 length:912 start_codon:yes stop_codon:yes gene_type:complete